MPTIQPLPDRQLATIVAALDHWRHSVPDAVRRADPVASRFAGVGVCDALDDAGIDILRAGLVTARRRSTMEREPQAVRLGALAAAGPQAPSEHPCPVSSTAMADDAGAVARRWSSSEKSVASGATRP